MVATSGSFLMAAKMEKTLLTVEIPAISKEYDVLVNSETTVGEITELLCRAVEDASDQAYTSSKSEILCLIEEQRVLKGNEVFGKYNIKNGDHLLML